MDLYKAIGYFEKALEKDPAYAFAFAGLADAYSILGNNSFLAPDESFPKAKEYTRKALEIDPDLAEAHTASGTVKRDYDWDFEGAEKEYQRSIEINPGDANTHHQYARLLSIMGRHEDAIREVNLSRDLDPLEPRVRANIGFFLYLSRKYEEALDELNRSVEFYPTQCANYYYLGFVYTAMGKHEEALRSQIKILECQKGIRGKEYLGSVTRLVELAWTYGSAGKTEEARRLLNELKEREKKYVSPARLARVYAFLGDYDVAFDLLERAYYEHDSRMIFIKVDPSYDPLRSDPRFKALLKKMNLD